MQNVFMHNNKPTLIFPQLTSDPLPLFQSREGLENDNNQEEISVNFVDRNNSWTLIQKKKRRQKLNDLNSKWNKQQRENFKLFGDPYYQEPYKFYHEVDISTPVANFPLQQPVTNVPLQQPPIINVLLQQPPIVNVPLQQSLPNLPLLQPAANVPVQQPLPLQPAVLPTPLPASPQPPQPLPIVPLPPPKLAPEVPKHILQAIPEEEEPAEPRQQGIEAAQLPLPPALSPARLQQLAAKLE
jgi:hypothetical protein